MLYGNLPEVDVDGMKYSGVTVKVQNPPKMAVLGLPTSEMIIERMDAQKSLRRSLGRRKSTTDYTPSTAADLKMFNKIRQDKGEEFDEFEASNAIAKLLSVDTISCEKIGDQYVVTLKTPFGENKHTMNVPFQRDLQKYRRTVIGSVDLPHGVEELRYRILPPCELYDSVAVSISGYNESTTKETVPPHHKSAAIVEVVQAMDDMDQLIDPNF